MIGYGGRDVGDENGYRKIENGMEKRNYFLISTLYTVFHFLLTNFGLVRLIRAVKPFTYAFPFILNFSSIRSNSSGKPVSKRTRRPSERLNSMDSA